MYWRRGNTRDAVFLISEPARRIGCIAIVTVLVHMALIGQTAIGWYNSNAPGDTLQVHISMSGPIPIIDSAIYTGYLRVNSLDPPAYPCIIGHFDYQVIHTDGYPLNDSCFKTPIYLEHHIEAFTLEGCRMSAREMVMRVYIATLGTCFDTTDYITVTNPEGEILGVSEDISSPAVFRIYANFPNPFNPVTQIRYDLAVSGFVSLKVYDLLGREVATLVDGKQESGRRSVEFDAGGLSSGMYVYRLRIGDFTAVRKLIVAK